ncbi:MAG: hypothetical protein APF77_00625 [Clostridia bacterium BRH_c25]|nr:MAG: hypothetical protein APF77_00625 [Clostridia bacterium BRH_c25]
MKPDNRHSHSNAAVSIPAEFLILRDKDSINVKCFVLYEPYSGCFLIRKQPFYLQCLLTQQISCLFIITIIGGINRCQ